MNKKYNLQKIKYYLVCASVLALATMIFTKKTVFNLNGEITAVENKIEELNRKKYMLEIEWVYLVSPERLASILENLSESKIKKTVISAKQIKSLDKLIPYYYAEGQKHNNKNPVAVKLPTSTVLDGYN